jgi:hypothetical protein
LDGSASTITPPSGVSSKRRPEASNAAIISGRITMDILWYQMVIYQALLTCLTISALASSPALQTCTRQPDFKRRSRHSAYEQDAWHEWHLIKDVDRD